MTSIAPSIPARSLHLSRRARRVLASTLVVAALFVPATSAATAVGPHAIRAVEVYVADHEPWHARTAG